MPEIAIHRSRAGQGLCWQAQQAMSSSRVQRRAMHQMHRDSTGRKCRRGVQRGARDWGHPPGRRHVLQLLQQACGRVQVRADLRGRAEEHRPCGRGCRHRPGGPGGQGQVSSAPVAGHRKPALGSQSVRPGAVLLGSKCVEHPPDSHGHVHPISQTYRSVLSDTKHTQ